MWYDNYFVVHVIDKKLTIKSWTSTRKGSKVIHPFVTSSESFAMTLTRTNYNQENMIQSGISLFDIKNLERIKKTVYLPASVFLQDAGLPIVLAFDCMVASSNPSFPALATYKSPLNSPCKLSSKNLQLNG